MADEKSQEELIREMVEEIGDIFDCFAPGGPLGPVDDPTEYERLAESLTPVERELNREVSNFIRLIDYFGRVQLKLTPDIADAMNAAAGLPVEQRIARVRAINEKLMRRIHDAGASEQFRM